MQSGSAILLNQLYSRADDLARDFTQMIGCYYPVVRTMEQLIQCLDQTPLVILKEAQSHLVQNNSLPFLPTIPSRYIKTFFKDVGQGYVFDQKEVLLGNEAN